MEDWCAGTLLESETSGIVIGLGSAVKGLVRESQKQTRLKYAKFSLVGVSNMLLTST